jgi:hypothetical protein
LQRRLVSETWAQVGRVAVRFRISAVATEGDYSGHIRLKDVTPVLLPGLQWAVAHFENIPRGHHSGASVPSAPAATVQSQPVAYPPHPRSLASSGMTLF